MIEKFSINQQFFYYRLNLELFRVKENRERSELETYGAEYKEIKRLVTGTRKQKRIKSNEDATR